MRKKRKKQKRRKQNPKGEPCLLAWWLNGWASASLCIYLCPQWDVAQLEGLEGRRGSLSRKKLACSTPRKALGEQSARWRGLKNTVPLFNNMLTSFRWDGPRKECFSGCGSGVLLKLGHSLSCLFQPDSSLLASTGWRKRRNPPKMAAAGQSLSVRSCRRLASLVASHSTGFIFYICFCIYFYINI